MVLWLYSCYSSPGKWLQNLPEKTEISRGGGIKGEEAGVWVDADRVLSPAPTVPSSSPPFIPSAS